jgi:2-iminobutanoate/2-iminopropanoate deaminase
MNKFDFFGFGVPWEDLANYSQAVRAGNLLFVSGQLSHDAQGNFLEGDVASQARAAFANLDTVLARFGAARDRVVQIDVFLMDLRANFEPAMAECARYFGSHRPASNVFGVVDLALPQQLIEIAATAALAD